MSNSRKVHYFFNTTTKESRWEAPEGMKEEEIRALPGADYLSGGDEETAGAPPGQMRASHLLVKHSGSRRPSSWKEPNITRSKAEAIDILKGYAAEINGDRNTFAKLASKHSDCSSYKAGGDLGWFGKGQMQKPFEEGVLALPVGGISDVVETDSALADGVDIRITKLLVHPIKSCRGISVSESRYGPEGLQFDRQYLIIEADTHKFITARQIPKMVLVEPAIEFAETPLLQVSFPESSGISSFVTPLIPEAATLESWELVSDIEIWLSTGLNAYVAQSLSPDGPSPSSLLSSFLGRNVLLVLKGPMRRAVETTSTHPDLDAEVRFQDGFPLLLTTTESLAAVQERVRHSANGAEGWKVGGITSKWQSEELVMERFRPNIVLSGSPAPFDEDYWGDVQIGENDTEGGIVSVVKRCGRCLLPNVDTVTGIRDNAVPFKVITKFRRVETLAGSTACFGVNAVAQTSGLFKVGDRLRVLTVLERETAEVREPPIPSSSKT
ncbi:hypothetical protein FRC07_014849 [Ceratobasidium sp. 392]|nr:hypothetical protein FRC07_014849 [Ceratobasidium sp. 392]